MSDPSPRTRQPHRIEADDEPSREPRYAVTAVAVRVGLRVETVRRYEAFGLIEAARDETGLARYSEDDVDRIRRARRLIDDLGVNLAGAAAILHMRQQLLAVQRELRRAREARPGA